MGLDGTRLGERVVEVEMAAVMGHPLAVEEPPDDRRELVEPVRALLAVPEPDPEPLVFLGEPAATEPQRHATAADVVDRDRRLGEQSRVPQRRGPHEQPEPRPARDGGPGGQRRPALEHRDPGIAHVVDEVIVGPERVEARGLRRDRRVAHLRPRRSMRPEARPEPDQRRLLVRAPVRALMPSPGARPDDTASPGPSAAGFVGR